MTAVATVPGDRGIDFSFANPSLPGTHKVGGRFIIRYSAGAGTAGLLQSSSNKICEPGTIEAAIKAGLDFIANSEWYETRIEEGAAAGAADGKADLEFWKRMGLAKGSAIYVSWDTAPVKSKWKNVDAYLKAYRKVLGGYYKLGVYAGTPYLRHALTKKLVDFGWRPNAGSWSNDKLPYQPKTGTVSGRKKLIAQALKATPAAIWQTGNYWWSKGADENIILRPCGSHLQALAAADHEPAKAPTTTTGGKKYYDSGPHQSALISDNQEFGLFLENDGSVHIRQNGKFVRQL